jgi:hypothetical protein
MIPHMTALCVNTTMRTHNGVAAIPMKEITLSEFSRTKRASKPLHVDIFDAPDSRYDVIIGRDLL